MASVKATGAVVAAISIGVVSFCLLHISGKKTDFPLLFNEKKKKKKNKKRPEKGLVDAIGNTPLIRINSLSDATGCEVSWKS